MDTTGRRVVSVVFADLVGFTTLSERLDAEDVARIQDSYFLLAARAVAEHGGEVEKYIGDAVVATFGSHRADDDDAERAVRAALRLVAGMHVVESEVGLPAGTLQVRVGVNTGEAVVTATADGRRVTGDVVNTASRLQSAAAPGQVLLGPETAFGAARAFTVEPHEELTLKGKALPLPVWRVGVERSERRRGLSLHGLEAPLLGREEHLAALGARLARAARGTGEAVLVVAPPGVGKSRLVDELVARAARAGHPCRVVRLGPHGAAGYRAVADLLRAAGVGEDLTRVRDVLVAQGYDPAHAEVHTTHAGTLLRGERLEAEPADLWTAWTAVLDAVPPGPAPVWVVEDVHLAGPDLRAFLRHAVAAPRRGGRLVVLTGRPTALTVTSNGTHGPAGLGAVDVVHLEPLPDATTRALVASLVGDGVVPEEFLTGVVGASGGNPLFVEELLRSWIQSGVLLREAGAWRFAGRTGGPALPSTVHAVYQGQLDALPGDARSLVERGSVPGITFPLDALPVLGVAEPTSSLGALTRAGLLVGPHAGTVSPSAYTYRHALLRDTAYASLSRRRRAELHARFARWLRDRAPRDQDLAELVGTHLATAVEQLPATAPGLDDGTSVAALATEAADTLEEAARSGLVSAPQQAALLLRRALALPATDDGGRRLRRHLLLAEAERRSGRLDEAMTAFVAAGEAARVREDRDALVEAALGHESALFASRRPRERWGPPGLELLRAAEAALAEDRTDGADARRSAVLSALGQALLYGPDPVGGAEACERAVALAEAGDDPAALARALLAQRASQTGPARLDDRLAGTGRARSAAARAGDPELRLEVARLRLVDLLEAGDLDGALAAQEEATALIEDLGRPLYFWYPPMWRSMRALVEGRHDEAAALVDAFAEAARRAHYRDADLVRAIQRMGLALDTGTGLEEVLPVLHRHHAADPERWTFALAVVQARLGRDEAARAALAHYTEADLTNVPTDLAGTMTMAFLAQAADLLGDAAAGRAVAGRLTPWAGRFVVLGSGALCLGSASHHLGLALRAAGDLPAAARRLEEAATEHQAAGATWLAARSRAELAATLARSGAPHLEETT